MSLENILDLNKMKSIKYFERDIDTKYLTNTIRKLIELVKMFGKNNGSIIRDIGETTQYKLLIKYLIHVLPIFFEFDYSYQFVNIIYYNNDQTKTYLKLFLSINDEPTIKYVENDHSGNIPSYHDDNINMKPGEYLINFSHCLLSYIGFERIRLDDDSYLITTNSFGNEMRTKLWLYRLLCHGKSWYSKFGYEPGNTSIHEYDLLITDVGNIKLCDILSCLKKLLEAANIKYFDQNLVQTSQKLVKLIDASNETIYQYTKNHTLEEFTDLTNNLTQSIFGRNVSLQIKNSKTIFGRNVSLQIKNSKTICCEEIGSDAESGEENNMQYYDLEFFWFDKYKKLLIGNVIQINNNIKKYFYQLSQ
jgi:hypothetical protein